MISQERLRRLGATAAVLALALALFSADATARADDAAAMKQALEQHAESIVSLKTVTQMSAPNGSQQDAEGEAAGVMISSDGLVLCSNMMLNGPVAMIQRVLGRNLPGLSSEIKTVKVVIGPNDEELDAKVLARDEDLDLAWVQIEKSDREFKAVDLAKAAEADLGARVVGVRRMGAVFDRAAVTAVATVCGQTERPRKLLVVQEDISDIVGLPMFNAAGEPIGVVVTQMPSAEDTGGEGNPLGMLSNLASMQEGVDGLILPAAEVVKATERAKAGEEGASESK